jgi:hypothetical protein
MFWCLCTVEVGDFFYSSERRSLNCRYFQMSLMDCWIVWQGLNDMSNLISDKFSLSNTDQSIMDVLKHKSFLEELLFWTIKYEFPQKMVTFLLNMLPDQEYKVSITASLWNFVFTVFFYCLILFLLHFLAEAHYNIRIRI